METLINNEQIKYDVTVFSKLITTAFEYAKQVAELREPVEVSVSFVDNGAIQLLNRQYRGIDVPTDVLSFPQDDLAGFSLPEGMPRVLGDIVISLERASDQATEYGHSMEREVVYLAVHGFFHLLGHDHHHPDDQAVMRGLEERVLLELDLGRDFR